MDADTSHWTLHPQKANMQPRFPETKKPPVLPIVQQCAIMISPWNHKAITEKGESAVACCTVARTAATFLAHLGVYGILSEWQL